jgi:hypothetical protein
MTGSAPTARAAASTSARVASGRPKRMLSATVAFLLPKPENRNPSWGEFVLLRVPERADHGASSCRSPLVQDLVGPLQVFASLRRFSDQYRPVVAERLEPMPTDGPLTVTADHSFGDVSDPAVVIVPGGDAPTIKAMGNPAIRDYLRHAADTAPVVAPRSHTRTAARPAAPWGRRRGGRGRCPPRTRRGGPWGSQSRRTGGSRKGWSRPPRRKV